MDSKKVGCRNKSLKVCLVSVLPPLHSGVSLYTKGLLSGLEERKPPCELVIVANKSAKEIAPEVKNVRLVKAWTKGVQYFFQVLSAVIKEKPDVVHLQHEFFLYGGMSSAALFPFLLLLMRLLGMKTVVTIHGVVPRNTATGQFAEAFFVPNNLILLKVGLGSLTTSICSLANTVIVHNSFAKHVLYYDHGIRLKKIKVIPHGVGLFKDKDVQDSHENIVLFFGNITPGKGLETLVQAFEHIRMSDAKLVIAGGQHPRGTEYFHQITRTVKSSSKSKNILTTGYIPDEDIHRLFRKCSIVVFPYTFSVSSSGGLSFAFQHQKPIIVTSLPSFTELITNGINGLVVPPNDPVALAHAIERLLSDTRFQERLSRGLRRDRDHLAWPVIAGETIKCYRPPRSFSG